MMPHTSTEKSPFFDFNNSCTGTMQISMVFPLSHSQSGQCPTRGNQVCTLRCGVLWWSGGLVNNKMTLTVRADTQLTLTAHADTHSTRKTSNDIHRTH